MGISNSMTGSPWHVETLKADDTRRNKSRCIHYEKERNFCQRRKLICVGSSHCDFYEEDTSVETINSRTDVVNNEEALRKKHKKRMIKKQKKILKNASDFCRLPIGTKLITKYGVEGILKAKEKGRITVEFKDKTVNYSYPLAFDCKYLKAKYESNESNVQNAVSD